MNEQHMQAHEHNTSSAGPGPQVTLTGGSHLFRPPTSPRRARRGSLGFWGYGCGGDVLPARALRRVAGAVLSSCSTPFSRFPAAASSQVVRPLCPLARAALLCIRHPSSGRRRAAQRGHGARQLHRLTVLISNAVRLPPSPAAAREPDSRAAPLLVRTPPSTPDPVSHLQEYRSVLPRLRAAGRPSRSPRRSTQQKPAPLSSIDQQPRAVSLSPSFALWCLCLPEFLLQHVQTINYVRLNN
jgi:hypothetical protein